MLKCKIILIFSIFLNSNFVKAINVSVGNELCQREINYVHTRSKFIKKSLEKFIGKKIKNKKYPQIDLCLSGGGYRSMISSLGFMQALEKIELLDGITYMSALSGSTWLLIPFLARILKDKEVNNFQEYRAKLENLVDCNFFDPFTFQLAKIEKFLKTKYKKRKKIDLVDFWGALISERLIGDIGANAGLDLTFSEIRDLFKYNKKYPFPLFSAALANKFPYHFLEVSPFSIYNDLLFWNEGGSISTEYFGNVFKNGFSDCPWSEENLGFFMGAFGSPYALSEGDIFIFALQIILEYLSEFKFLFKFEKFLKKDHLFKNHFFPALIPNFTFGMKKTYFKSSDFEVIDGGFKFNLPFVPLFRRDSDIIIVCDASSDAAVSDLPELQLVEHFAKINGIKFPSLDNPKVISDNLKIFFDSSNSQTPIIVYFANVIDDSTLKFDYPIEEFRKLSDFMKNLVYKNKNEIVNVIKHKIEILN